VEIERRGKILKIVPTDMPQKLDNLIDRRDFVRGDPEDLVHLDWSSVSLATHDAFHGLLFADQVEPGTTVKTNPEVR